MAVINTNVKALFSQMALKSSGLAQSKAMEQLSTGKRINSARDDAAGMSIATRMTHQIRSLNQAVRNAGDAINLIQTAEGATNEITDMMQRMRELAVQAVNDTNSNEDRSYLDLEFQQLKQQIVQMADNTEWNGFPVLNGKAGEQVGEMPVYKVTSDNQFGGVFIQPTTTRTITGTDAGEVQQFTLTGNTPQQGVISVAGVPVQVTSTENTLEKLATKVVTTLNNSDQFTAHGMRVSYAMPAVAASATPERYESSVVTFSALAKGESVTVAGLTLTATNTAGMTAAQVGAAFANIRDGETPANGSPAAAATSYIFKGKMTGQSTGAVNVAAVTFTATAEGNLTDLAPSVAASTKEVVSYAAGTTTAAFETVTVGGLTITQTGATALSATDVANALANIAFGTQFVNEQKTNYQISGTATVDFGAAAAGVITMASTGITNIADVTSAKTGAGTAGTVTVVTQGAVAGTNTVPTVTVLDGEYRNTVTFNSLDAGETVTIDGLSFTAAKTLTGSQVASYFASLTAGVTPTNPVDQAGTFSGQLANFSTMTATTGSSALIFKNVQANATTQVPVVVANFKLSFSASDGDVAPVSVSVGSTGMTPSAVTTLRKAVTLSQENIANQGNFLLSGGISFAIPAGAKLSDAISASFVSDDNETTALTGYLSSTSPAVITFAKNDGLNSKLISGDLTYTLQDADGGQLNLADVPRGLSVSIGVAGSIPSLRDGDLLVNGINVGPSLAADDRLSPRNNASGSAIAKAAAINRIAVDQGISQGQIQSVVFSGTPMTGTITVGGVSVALSANDSSPTLAAAKIAAAMKASPLYDSSTGRTITYAEGSASISVSFPPSEGIAQKLEVKPGATGLGSVVNTTQQFATKVPGTGVFAKVNENVLNGQSMTAGPVATGVVFVNGFASANITTVYNNSQATRENVVRAINLISDKTGVKAINTGSDEKGITMVAADGRNIEIQFETTGSTNEISFGQRIGMREGVQSATISLESKIQAPVVLSSDAAGDITRSGLVSGNYSKNEAVLNTKAREAVNSSVAQVNSVKLSGNATAGNAVSLVVNGTTFTTNDTLAGGLTPQALTNNLISQINTNSTLGVFATKGRETGEVLLTSRTPGVAFTLAASANSGATVGVVASEVTVNQKSGFKNLGMNDLEINGIAIRPTTPADDIYSTSLVSSSDPGSSAIALAAAINDSTSLTGVKAYANPAVTEGSITSTETPVSGKQHLWVNGIDIEVDFVQNESGTDRRAKVVSAINERTGQHGVMAQDNGKGVTLTTDGRNLSVWFDSSQDELAASDFGLDKGGSVAQVSKITVANTGAALPGVATTQGVAGVTTESSAVTFVAMAAGEEITVAGLTFKANAAMTAAEVATVFASKAAGTSPASPATGTFSGTLTGFSSGAAAGAAVTFTSSTLTTNVTDISVTAPAYVMVNGVSIRADLPTASTPSATATALALAINSSTSLKNVTAVAANGVVTVTSNVPGSAFDLRAPAVNANSSQTLTLSTVTENSQGKNDVSAVDMSTSYRRNVLGSATAPESTMNIKTVYATVRMVSDAPVLPALPGADGLPPDMMNVQGKPIQIRAGSDGFGSMSNFMALGFNEGSFGGRASVDMEPPRVGRMAFQVGSSANQVITIDLADFGKKGPITGEITGDVDLNVEQRTVRINSRDGATAVLNLLDDSMDKINATRATMGAVMNRLDHVINNLTNVSMNMSASRSSIEDADYASASTELAKTQIMQQAATAVLAQANTSQQSVMKLLGG